MSTFSISPTDLPAVQGDAPLPNGRQFYGAIAGQFRERGLTFGEVIHSSERKVPDHTHEVSYYSLIISGGYDESYGRGRVYFHPFSSALTRAGTKHDGRIAPSGVRVFTVEIGEEWIRQFRDLQPEPDVCGSRSLFNISRLLGGMMPKERATLIDTTGPSILPRPVLKFPRPPRVCKSSDRAKKSRDAMQSRLFK
jgi:hypothetical protein